MTQVVVTQRRAYRQTRPAVLAGLALLMAITAAVNLAIGIDKECYHDSYCDYRKRAYIISGSCFAISTVCFLIAAISLHFKQRKARRENQSNPNQVAIPVPPQYPMQPIGSYPVMQAQYPPPYSPQAGPAPYPFTTPNQYTPQVGFAISQPAQPNTQQVTQPSSYAP